MDECTHVGLGEIRCDSCLAKNLTTDERAAFQAMRARGVRGDLAYADALDGVDVETARGIGPVTAGIVVDAKARRAARFSGLAAGPLGGSPLGKAMAAGRAAEHDRLATRDAALTSQNRPSPASGAVSPAVVTPAFAAALFDGLMIHGTEDQGEPTYWVECNYCSTGDFEWDTPDWITPAVLHIFTHHADKLPQPVALS